MKMLNVQDAEEKTETFESLSKKSTDLAAQVQELKDRLSKAQEALHKQEGSEEGLVDLNSDHYEGTGITYLGFPLWDAPGCNLIPYLGIAADYICSAIDQSGT